MRRFPTALGLSSCLAVAGAILMAPTISSAQPAESSYVACNRYGDCWRVNRMYAYGPDVPITYYRFRTDPVDGPGYYDQAGRWHPDPAARVVAGGAVGAGLGAAIGCIVTLPVGCAPGAAVGAAVGGGTGAVAGAASTPR
jgi:hypothetical protein